MKKLFAFLMCAIMCLTLLSSCNVPEHEHTMSDWKYNETEHWREPVCGINNCIIQAEVHDLGEHSDEDKNEICDVCGYCIVADQPIDPIYPAEKSYFEVIDKFQISDIQKIETVQYAGSVAPNMREPIEHKTSTLTVDIETVYAWLKGLQGTLTKLSNEEANLAGSGTNFLTIYTTEYYFTISDVGRNYLNVDGSFYEQESNTPEIVGEKVSYTFESYYDDAKVYIDGIQIGTADFAFEDIVCERVDAEQHERLLWMDTCIGTIDVYSSQYFGRNGTTYKIISGTDFTGIINSLLHLMSPLA